MKSKSEKKRVDCLRETHLGVPPEVLKETEKCSAWFKTYKSAKKGQNSFRITKALLESLFEKSKQVGKEPHLIITIDDNGNKYEINCTITKISN